MRTHVAYGRGRLELRLPPDACELRTRPVEALARPAEALAEALRNPIGCPPLRQLAAGRRHACLVVSDITRPVPYRVLLPPLLAALEGAVERVSLLVATGTHRPSTAEEKLEMFGPEVVARYPIVDHDSRDPAQLVALERRPSSGTQVWLNRLYLEADLRILTGLVEPHFMAGYSGGRKAICPGLADLRTIQKLHGPRFLEDPRAASGVLEGNPCHREASEIAHMAGADFTVNVALDLQRRIVGLFAGHLDAAFDAAVARVDSFCRAAVPAPADIAVTSGGGYPLDKTFYQAVKGMVAALPVVRPGGVVLLAAECREGIGNREYAELLFRYDGRHADFLRDIAARDEVLQDQWEFEEQCKVLARVGVEGLVVCCGGIERGTLRRLSVTPAADLCGEADPQRQLQGALDALLRRRPAARVAALPDGPYILAEVDPR
ncbi:MAG TPA: nickel-dependent lactate racemase [Planctomycetota bacterium]|nr:nickel-dependent lactate racemase [Planctomycetota bacterium]HRR81990.1 nickel-dependent lactate racemase [Planctomycetota bacterium]HRT94442.1 nickel-dependent lactate racemase [Planctomycetota bacterium]